MSPPRGWLRHRSAPVGVLLAGSAVLIVSATVAIVFYLSVVRGASGLAAYTAGLPTATLARPLGRRAVYRLVLGGPIDRETPAGTPSIAHRWSVRSNAAGAQPLCTGDALDQIVAADETGVADLDVPLPPDLFAAHPPQPVPPRVVATCASALEAMQRGEVLSYVESVAPRALSAEVVACLDAPRRPAALVDCEDGAPPRIYASERPALARQRVRGAMYRVAGCAGAFAFVCFLIGWMSLRRFDRRASGATS